jgi:alpha-N-arabinofuranosidase
LVNVIAPIMTRNGGGAWAQTIFWPLMHASRYGRGTALRAIVNTPVYDCADYEGVPELDATATLSDAGEVTIFAVNRSLDEPMHLTVDLRDFAGVRSVLSHEVLHHDDVKAINTEEKPDEVSPVHISGGQWDGGKLAIEIPALSWNVIRLGK